MPLSGPDVSHFQGLVDWWAVRAHGHTFAFAKATEGTGYRDTRFPQNWPAMREAGLVRGAYHFLRTSDPVLQARHYVATVGSFTDALAVVDVETAGDGTNPGISHVRGFATEFKRLVPNHPLIVYTGRWYWVGRIGDPYGADIGPLWHSEYDGANPFDAEVLDGPEGDNYGGWSGATFWQHTSSGSCPGINGNCDLNLFYGDRNGLIALTGGQSQPQPQPFEEEEVFYVVLDVPPHNVALGGPGYWKHLNGTENAIVAKSLARAAISVSQGEYDNLRAACVHGERCSNDAVG